MSAPTTTRRPVIRWDALKVENPIPGEKWYSSEDAPVSVDPVTGRTHRLVGTF